MDQDQSSWPDVILECQWPSLVHESRIPGSHIVRNRPWTLRYGGPGAVYNVHVHDIDFGEYEAKFPSPIRTLTDTTTVHLIICLKSEGRSDVAQVITTHDLESLIHNPPSGCDVGQYAVEISATEDEEQLEDFLTVEIPVTISYYDKNGNQFTIRYLLNYDIYMEKGEMIRTGKIEKVAPIVVDDLSFWDRNKKHWATLTDALRKMFRGRQTEQPGTAQGTAPDNPTRKWSRHEKLLGWTLVIAVVTLPAAYLVVPEVRRFLRLEREPSVTVPTSVPVAATAPAPIPPTTKVFGVSAKNVEQLRKSNNVTRMKEVESGKMLSEIPAGSFGFAGEYYIGDALKNSRINALELQPHAPLDRFEIDKLSDGRIELIGYVGPETLESVRSGLSQGEAITFYSDSWPDAANVVAVPLTQFLCPRERSLSVGDPKDPRHDKFLSALDCQVK